MALTGKKTNIALIGFMGTGKTSVGEALADRLGILYVRIDDLIVEQAGKPIPEIFRQDGEKRFRELEAEVVRTVSGRRGAVIDCGGGVVLEHENIEQLRQNSAIILLTSSPEVILKRISENGDQRPLFNNVDKPATIRKLLSIREPLYRDAADYVVDTSRLSVKQVVEKILEYLGSNSLAK
jgi:shikimate kinase